MPRIRDTQGHKVEVTQEQFNSGEAVICDRCGAIVRSEKPKSKTLPELSASDEE